MEYGLTKPYNNDTVFFYFFRQMFLLHTDQCYNSFIIVLINQKLNYFKKRKLIQDSSLFLNKSSKPYFENIHKCH